MPRGYPRAAYRGLYVLRGNEGRHHRFERVYIFVPIHVEPAVGRTEFLVALFKLLRPVELFQYVAGKVFGGGYEAVLIGIVIDEPHELFVDLGGIKPRPFADKAQIDPPTHEQRELERLGGRHD